MLSLKSNKIVQVQSQFNFIKNLRKLKFHKGFLDF